MTDDAAAGNRELGRNFFQEQDRLCGAPAEELCAPEYTAARGGHPPMPLFGIFDEAGLLRQLGVVPSN